MTAVVLAHAVFTPADPPRTGMLVIDGERLGLDDALPWLLAVEEPAPAPVRFWAAVARAALGLVARGRLLPGVSPAGWDAWRAGLLDPSDAAHLRALAAAMPEDAPALLPAAAPLVRAFVDAVVDTVVRVPGESTAFASPEPVAVPELREWAADVAAGVDVGVQVSLRLDGDPATRMRVVVQVHALDDPTRLADLADVWSGAAVGFGPEARVDALRAVRRAARFWGPLEQLLTQAVPDAVELDDTDLADLLDTGAAALAAAGVSVHRPRDLAAPSTQLVVGDIGGPGEARARPVPARLGGRVARHPAHRRRARRAGPQPPPRGAAARRVDARRHRHPRPGPHACRPAGARRRRAGGHAHRGARRRRHAGAGPRHRMARRRPVPAPAAARPLRRRAGRRPGHGLPRHRRPARPAGDPRRGARRTGAAAPAGPAATAARAPVLVAPPGMPEDALTSLAGQAAARAAALLAGPSG